MTGPLPVGELLIMGNTILIDHSCGYKALIFQLAGVSLAFTMNIPVSRSVLTSMELTTTLCCTLA